MLTVAILGRLSRAGLLHFMSSSLSTTSTSSRRCFPGQTSCDVLVVVILVDSDPDRLQSARMLGMVPGLPPCEGGSIEMTVRILSSRLISVCPVWLSTQTTLLVASPASRNDAISFKGVTEDPTVVVSDIASYINCAVQPPGVDSNVPFGPMKMSVWRDLYLQVLLLFSRLSIADDE